MIKGIYTSASGMIPLVKKQEVSANNLANASAPGFKRDSIFLKELTKAEQKKIPAKSDWERPMANQVYTDYASGGFDRTGNDLDFAIDGEGFFRIELADGTEALTRSGSFTIDGEGYLAFPGGARVVTSGGPLEVGAGKVVVTGSGQISIDGTVAGSIAPVTVPDLTKLQKLGGSMFLLPQGAEVSTVANSNIQQGFLENSNVDIVSEMVEMIISFRQYEANAKALQSQDGSLEQLFTKVIGRG